MRVNQAGERSPFSLPTRRLGEQVFILTDQDSIQLPHPIQQIRIVQLRCTIQLGSKNIYIPQQETTRNSSGHVHVRVEANAHASLPRARNFFLIGDSPVLARNCSTRSKLRWISPSNSAL